MRRWVPRSVPRCSRRPKFIRERAWPHASRPTLSPVRAADPFSECDSVFPDPKLVAAIVDRVTFNAHILETGTPSYRLRTIKSRNRRR